MSKEETKLGVCPLCGKNRDIPGIGLAHLCRPASSPPIKMSPILGIKPEKKRPVKLKGKVAVVEVEAPLVRVLQAKADAVPAKTGRPRKHTPEERKAMRAELMRKKRAAAREGK